MATKRVVIDDADDQTRRDAEDLAQLNEDEGGEVFRAIEEMRGVQGTVVVVVKLAPSEEKGFCDNIPVAEFSHEELKKRFGAGLYKVRVRGPKGFLPGGGNVQISPVGIVKPRAESAGGEFMSYLEFMQKRDAEKSDKLGRLTELALPGIFTLLTALLTRNQGMDMGSLVTALKPAPGPTLTDLTVALTNMRQLSAPAGESKDPVDMVLRVFEAANSLRGEDGGKKGDTNWLDIVRDVIKEGPGMVKTAMDGLKNAQTAPVVTSIVQPTPPPAVAAPMPTAPTAPPVGNGSAGFAANSEEPTDMRAMLRPFFKPHLTKILEWCKADKDTQTYSEVFIDELPREFAQYIPQDKALEYLKHEKWFTVVCEEEPGFVGHREWCDEFRLALIDLLSPQPGETHGVMGLTTNPGE